MKHMAGLFSSVVKGPELRAEDGSVVNSQLTVQRGSSGKCLKGPLFRVTVLSFEKALRGQAENNSFPAKRIVILFSFLLFTEI